MNLSNLTILEKDVLQAVVNNDYSAGNPHGAGWSWAINDACEVVQTKSFSGVVSSLSKKGVVICQGSGDDACISLTDLGRELWTKLEKVLEAEQKKAEREHVYRGTDREEVSKVLVQQVHQNRMTQRQADKIEYLLDQCKECFSLGSILSRLVKWVLGWD